MFVRELSIGGIGLSNLAVVFTDAHTFKQLGLDRQPALLLGMNAMRAFKKVSIDFATHSFRVVLPEHSQRDVQMATVPFARRRRRFEAAADELAASARLAPGAFAAPGCFPAASQ